MMSFKSQSPYFLRSKISQNSKVSMSQDAATPTDWNDVIFGIIQNISSSFALS